MVGSIKRYCAKLFVDGERFLHGSLAVAGLPASSEKRGRSIQIGWTVGSEAGFENHREDTRYDHDRIEYLFDDSKNLRSTLILVTLAS